MNKDESFPPEVQTKLNAAADAALAVITVLIGRQLDEVIMAALLVLIKAYLSAHAPRDNVEEASEWIKESFQYNLNKHFERQSTQAN